MVTATASYDAVSGMNRNNFGLVLWSPNWNLGQKVLAALLLIVFSPLLLLAVLLALLAGSGVLGKQSDFTIDEVIDFIESFLEGTGGEWDWDEFESCGENADSFLNDAWRKCLELELPLTEEGEATLRVILAELKVERRRRNVPFND